MVKNLPAIWETWVLSLGWEDPLEEGMATHSSILAWRIPWTEEPVGYRPWGQKVEKGGERLTLLLLPSLVERLCVCLCFLESHIPVRPAQTGTASPAPWAPVTPLSTADLVPRGQCFPMSLLQHPCADLSGPVIPVHPVTGNVTFLSFLSSWFSPSDGTSSTPRPGIPVDGP